MMGSASRLHPSDGYMESNFMFELVQVDIDPNRHNPAAAREQLRARPLMALRDFKTDARNFRPDRGLATAINMALAVGAPLLLTGEPGTGKTQVAWYLGWYFGLDVFDYPVKSVSTAEDLKYDFDAVAYLRAAQHPSEQERRRERAEFLQKRALWLAYDHAEVSVLLIDEIDKAPRDFPNDLLQELDKHEFHHPFDPQQMIRPRSGKPPIVVITSNAERRLPDAFLRRCIFHHIELTDELVYNAIKSHFPKLSEDFQKVVLDRFKELRKVPQLQKKPSTAEVLIWLAILSALGTSAEELRSRRLRDLPGLTALLKDKDDLERL
jgi:MoxR-like ATPase